MINLVLEICKNPRISIELKEATREEIRHLSWSICTGVMETLVLCLKKRTELNGGHLEYMLHDKNETRKTNILRC